MPWIDAFIPAEQQYREAVMHDTWGHLAPEKNKSYPGRIVFAFGVYDSGELNPTALVCDFGDLDGGPWLYDAIGEFLDRFTPGEPGRVYEWTGTFRNYPPFHGQEAPSYSRCKRERLDSAQKGDTPCWQETLP